ncbi:MAG: ABC transporter ATP-binding protein [Bdellovibrionota bacterium]
MIQLKNLCKRYGNFNAVNNISLEIQEGEIFGFLGVNGAGKTTTLRMLTGVLKPTSGSIEIGGFDIQKQPEEVKRITGFIPDRPYLYSKLTGREYLYFVAELHSVPQATAEARIDSLLKQYSLSDWEDELIDGFSHGMKQRLAMCAALIHDPKVLIVDEPMVGLDPHGAKLLKTCFRQYADSGVSILLSTHSLNVAEELADRLAIIHRGSVIAVGTLEDMRTLAGGANQRLEEIFLQLTWSGGEEYGEGESVQ